SSFVQLFNSSKDRIEIVERFWVNPVGTTNVTVSIGTTIRGATGSSFAFPRDLRFQPAPIVPTSAITARDTIVISHGNQAPPFVNETSLGAIQAAIGVWTELLFGPFVLPPGTGVMVSSVTLNNQIAAWFSGRSRQARPEELAPGARPSASAARGSPPGPPFLFRGPPRWGRPPPAPPPPWRS